MSFKIHLSSAFIHSCFESATLCFIAGLLLLSLLSLAFVFHLHLKSRNSHHLQGFNALWTVRFLLISFITLWALNELLRLPLFRKQYLYPFLTSLTLSQQAKLCKVQVVLSLGFLEPGFLVILLFLVNVSIKKKTPRGSWVLVFVSATCLPVLILQVLFLFVSRLDELFPEMVRKSSVVLKSGFGNNNEIVLCAYPLISCIMFGAFGIWYSVFFSLSCFKAVTLAINRGLRGRIYGLAFAGLIMLPLQIVFLVLSVIWGPEKTPHAPIAFLVFLCTLALAAVGEGILIIRPISDSLAAGGESCRWPPPEGGQTLALKDSVQV